MDPSNIINVAMMRESIAEFRYAKNPEAPTLVRVDPAWEARWIVKVPFAWGSLRLNRAIVDAVKLALDSATAAGAKIDNPTTCGYQTRRTWHDPKRGPSRHALGLAVDVNWKIGKVPDGSCDPRIVAALKAAGFQWGGDWPGKECDPMHFDPDPKRIGGVLVVKESAGVAAVLIGAKKLTEFAVA